MSKTKDSPEKELPVDYDGNWKEFLHFCLKDFLQFRFRRLYRVIDWSKPPVFLEQELRLALKKVLKGKKISDLLVKVWLKNGEEKYLLIHLEVQSYFDSQIAKRVYEYHSLISINLGIEGVETIVLYAGDEHPKQYNRYFKRVVETTLDFRFATLRVTDEREQKLLHSRNPAALALLANLWTLKSKKDLRKRLYYKEQIFLKLRELHFPQDVFQEIFIFVKNLMVLSDSIEKSLMSKVIPVERSNSPLPFRVLKSKRENRQLADIFFHYATGIVPSREIKALKTEKAKIEAQKAKIEAQKAEAEAQKAEAEAQKAEAEAQKAEAKALAKAEAAAKKAEAQKVAKLKKSILTLAKKMDWGIEEVAANLALDREFVEQVIFEKK
jgi:F0F1-type ATP synthase membrane subunit b/b'